MRGLSSSLHGSSGLIALVVVLGAGAGCSRPNPGFEVALRPDVGSSSESSSGTPTTTEPPVMSTSGDSSGALTVTSGDESTSTSSSSSGGESSSTGTVELHWPLDCPEPVRTPLGLASADTFFLNKPGDDPQPMCFSKPGKCANQALGLVPVFTVYYSDGGDGTPVAEDAGGLFAVRFAEQTPLFDGQYEVPSDAFLGVEVTVQVARSPNNLQEWEPINFRVYRMPNADEPWLEGDNTILGACDKGEATFRCQGCGTDPEIACSPGWLSGPAPYEKGVGKQLEVILEKDPTHVGGDLVIPFMSDWEWLFDDGLLLVPGPLELVQDVIEVRAREYEEGQAGPFIDVVHCPPEFI